MKIGVYESLITEALKEKLEGLDRERFFVADQKGLDKAEAVHFLSLHLQKAFQNALNAIKSVKGEQGSVVKQQIEITNQLLIHLSDHIEGYDISEDLVASSGQILEGVLDKLNSDYQSLDLDRKSTRLNSSHVRISYAVFCLK